MQTMYIFRRMAVHQMKKKSGTLFQHVVQVPAAFRLHLSDVVGKYEPEFMRAPIKIMSIRASDFIKEHMRINSEYMT